MGCLRERRAAARRGRGDPARWRPRGWASPGLGEGMAGFARGMDGTRALRPPGGPRHPRRRREGTPIPGGGRWLPIDYSWQGGQGPALEPDSWAGESGPRDAGAACRGGNRGAPRLEPVLWAPHVWEPAETRLAGAQAAGSSSQGCRACGRRGWAEVPRAEWAERPGLGLLPRGRRAGGRRSGFRGDPAPPPAGEAEAGAGRRAGAPGELLVPE